MDSPSPNHKKINLKKFEIQGNFLFKFKKTEENVQNYKII